ncbi:LLM class flavin-dependent oxidoreductase [Paenibacillus sp. JX-17]|uniref:LLM class flavin-dependent oxidoreductase n=1 Tax=Paenibacillus lacisoli TaxID=3064525 RepID=A0ABT9CD04_9BACL|nr:LLM class flavin-dependent oxidoreductase [Paenibacillus sp. JX-17]MDO7906458.1 LLM class flavin-dependent oxidoreductase [Paenibacillus sp. JX-17]
MTIKLSILDQSPVSEGSTHAQALARTAQLAVDAEKLGYSRFWVSEHHAASNLAGSSPEVLISHIAAKTASIRVGSGGVMLPHYSSYKVAENFRVLEGLYPGRIDLGLGRAPGGMPLATRALQEGKVRGGIDLYPEQIEDLLGYIHDDLKEGHRFIGLEASPAIETVPDMWLLGSSSDSAVLAAEKGVGFAFAQFINGDGGTQAMRWYQNHFQPSAHSDKPRALVAVFAICAETEEEANRLASSMDLSLVLLEKGMRTAGTPSVDQALNYPYTPYDLHRIRENRKRMVVGSPEQVKEQIEQLAAEYNCGEVMIASIIHDYEAKRRSIELIARAFGLGGN